MIHIARRKRYIKGRVYTLNDHVLVNFSKGNRKVVALNNNKNEMHVRRITSLYDKNGKRKNVIPIEKYSDIPKPSGIEKRTFRKTVSGKPIKEKYLTKTKTRLNRWDQNKMFWK